MVSTLASRGSTEGRRPEMQLSLSLVSTQGPQLAVLCVEPNCIKFIVSACPSHDPRWAMGRCGRNGQCRKTRCFRRHKWRDVLRGGASNAHAPPPVAVLPGPCPPQETHGQIGAQRAGATASPEGLGEPRARTGPRKVGTHCLSRVLVPWPRDYCIDCAIKLHRYLQSEVSSARAFAWRLRLRVSR